MENSKLILLLNTFEGGDLRAFSDFVASPYFNKKESLQKLYNYLKPLAKVNFPLEKIKREKVFDALYPGEPFEKKRFNHLMSGLFQLGERFISLRNFEKDGIMPDYYLLSYYVNRKLHKPYKLAYRQTQKKLETNGLRNERFYFQQSLLADIADRYFQSRDIRQYDKSLEEAAGSFDIYFFSKKLKYLCEILGVEKILSVPYEKSMLEEIKNYLAQNEYKNIPSITIYHTLLKALTEEEEEEHFKSLKIYLKKYASFFSQNEMKNLYFFAINFCIDKIRHGQKRYAEELMELYQGGVERGILLEDGLISPWAYKNMVKLGISLKRFEWVGNFVKSYSDKLPEGKRADAFHFNMADLFYNKKDYIKALHHLNQVEFSDVHYSIGARNLLIKIYFETEAKEAFLSLVFSFKLFLKRNKLISKEAKLPYQNFLKLVYRLDKYGKTRLSELEDEIKNTPILTNKPWLLEQLNKIKNSRTQK